jgi:hypothetical protein
MRYERGRVNADTIGRWHAVVDHRIHWHQDFRFGMHVIQARQQ